MKEFSYPGILVKFIAAFLGLMSVLVATSPELDRARGLYDRTDYERSLTVLQAIPSKDGPAYTLMGRNYYMQRDYKKASEVLEKAAAAEPDNAEVALWLGRAYGRRAETSSPFTAPGQASKARQYFEKAVALDPHYLEALNDLFEYYLEAPGFLGGGTEKAEAAAARIGRLDAAEGHWAQARLAEKRKEYGSAEDQLRRAMQVAPHEIGRVIDLARFLAKQGRVQESDRSFAVAERMAPDSPKLMYARADVYIQEGRNLEVARNLLHRYLNSALTPDDPPRSEAAKLLRQVQGS
jgi:tetratricopeptide (TPR) repeat protein